MLEQKVSSQSKTRFDVTASTSSVKSCGQSTREVWVTMRLWWAWNAMTALRTQETNAMQDILSRTAMAVKLEIQHVTWHVTWHLEYITAQSNMLLDVLSGGVYYNWTKRQVVRSQNDNSSFRSELVTITTKMHPGILPDPYTTSERFLIEHSNHD